MYLGDSALLPAGAGAHLHGTALMEVLHAEHFARLSAEYGASIIRDAQRPGAQHDAIYSCRARAKQMLMAAWRPHLKSADVDLDEYASNAVAPLLPDDPLTYLRFKQSGTVPRRQPAASS